MADIKEELANVIRAKTDDELLAMVLDRDPATLVTKPVVSQKTPRRRNGNNRREQLRPGDPEDLIYKAVSGMDGVCITSVVDITRISRSTVKRIISALKKEKRVFQGGERRFARYAVTQEAADRASRLARTAGGK